MSTPSADHLDHTATAMIAEVRAAQRDNLTHAWEMGRLLDEALRDQDEAGSKGIAKDLIQRLNRAGCELALSTLYGYRSIYQGYERDELPELVERGITQTHALLLVGLGGDTRSKIEAQMAQPDGGTLSSRELRKLINDERKAATRADADAVTAASQVSREHGEPLSPAPMHASMDAPSAGNQVERVNLLAQPTPADGSSVVPGSAANEGVGEAPGGVAAKRGDIERTKAMARGPREFSVSPIKVMKSADTTAISMLGQAKDLLVALDEVDRLGYDSDRSLRNFLDAAGSLQASLASYQRLLPEIQERLRVAINANTIAD